MRVIRSLAVKISATVERFASPGAKEWAQGLAAEVEFVEGDWRALGWALGSLRVLLRYREAQAGSLEEVLVAARKLVDSRGVHQWIWVFLFVIYGLERVGDYFKAIHHLQKIGCGMAAFGYFSLGILSVDQLLRNAKVPADDDDETLLMYYKARLERVRDFPTSWLAMMLSISFAFLSCGTVLMRRGGYGSHAIWSVTIVTVYLAMIWLVMDQRRASVRRLARLNELLAKRQRMDSI